MLVYGDFKNNTCLLGLLDMCLMLVCVIEKTSIQQLGLHAQIGLFDIYIKPITNRGPQVQKFNKDLLCTTLTFPTSQHYTKLLNKKLSTTEKLIVYKEKKGTQTNKIGNTIVEFYPHKSHM